MSLWLVIALVLGLVKVSIAALMLWLPFRNDEAMNAPPASDDGSEDDGGLHTLPHVPRPFGARPRRPRRGPHGGDAAPSPPRVRTATRSRRAPARR